MNCSMGGRRMLLYMLCVLSGVCLLHGQLGATLAGSFVVKALNLFAVRGSKQMFPGTAPPPPPLSLIHTPLSLCHLAGRSGTGRL